VADEKPGGIGGLDGLANLVKHFIIRDIIYAIGGGLLIMSIVYAAGALREELEFLGKAPTVISLLLIGTSWAIGYAVSDGLGGVLPMLFMRKKEMATGSFSAKGGPKFWPFVRPDFIDVPQELPKRLFQSFSQQAWEARDQKVTVDDVRAAAAALIDREFGSYHRTVLLRHLGTAVGACGLLASVITLVGVAYNHSPLGWWFSIGGFLISVLLLMIGWIKALQQTHEINKEANRRKQLDQSARREGLSCELERQFERL
jgi:hypothetical protein